MCDQNGRVGGNEVVVKGGFLSAFALAGALLASPTWSQQLKVDDSIVPTSISTAQQETSVKAARTYAEFWNTGDESLLTASVAPSFVDHTLPAGRPQGPEGPALGSKNLRAAVPDLSVEVKKMIVTNDYVTVNLEFKGHFTGSFRNQQGNGQAIHFIAFNVLKVTNGLVTDNWHLEDNLALLSQMGLAEVRH
jgi:predicted ester cyclase